MALTEGLLQLTDAFLPRSIREGDAYARKQGQLVIAFTLSALVWSPIFAVLHFYFLDQPFLGSAALLALPLGFFLILALRISGSFRLAGNLLAGFMFAELAFISFRTGGIFAPAMTGRPSCR